MSESEEKEEKEEEDSDLEEELEEAEEEIQEESFREFIQPIKSSPILEKILPTQEDLSLEAVASSGSFEEEKKDFGYIQMNEGGTYHSNSNPNENLERFDMSNIGKQKTAEELREESRKIHSQNFVQDSRLSGVKDKYDDKKYQ